MSATIFPARSSASPNSVRNATPKTAPSTSRPSRSATGSHHISSPAREHVGNQRPCGMAKPPARTNLSKVLVMVAVKAADVDAFVARPDPVRRVVLVFGPDAGLIGERVRAVLASVDDMSDPFALARLNGEELAA